MDGNPYGKYSLPSDHHSNRSVECQDPYLKIQQLEQKLSQKDKALDEVLERVKQLELNSSKPLNNSKEKSKEIKLKAHRALSEPLVSPSKSRRVVSSRAPITHTTPDSKKNKRESYQKVTSLRTLPQVASPKQHPYQMILSEMPEGFERTKESFFTHIKLLWGLVEQKPIPTPPQKQLLAEFHERFTDAVQIRNAVDDARTADLIALNEVQTLKNTRSGRIKLGRGIIYMQEFFLRYIHSSLAKLGIRLWAPDLEDSADSLYNEACRISAIKTFSQIASSGAYEYMNINLKYVNNISLLVIAYNHYVHYIMAERYRKEIKAGGTHEKEEARKATLVQRRRLQKVQLDFAKENKFPIRYKNVIAEINAHSDDEFNAKHQVYIVKSLPFRSNKANEFFKRLDQEMEKAAQVNGKPSKRRNRRRPKRPIISEFKKAPKGLPLDFYNIEWFNSLNEGQRTVVADIHSVAFLPEAKLSILGAQVPDEKLTDKKFTQKHWDTEAEPYDLSHRIEEDEEEDSELDDNYSSNSYCGQSIDLEDTSGSSGNEEEGDYEAEEEENEEEFDLEVANYDVHMSELDENYGGEDWQNWQ